MLYRSLKFWCNILNKGWSIPPKNELLSTTLMANYLRAINYVIVYTNINAKLGLNRKLPFKIIQNYINIYCNQNSTFINIMNHCLVDRIPLSSL